VAIFENFLSVYQLKEREKFLCYTTGYRTVQPLNVSPMSVRKNMKRHSKICCDERTTGKDLRGKACQNMAVISGFLAVVWFGSSPTLSSLSLPSVSSTGNTLED
jgi:hypothetical protein